VGVEENVRARGRTLAHPLIYGVNFFSFFFSLKTKCVVFFFYFLHTHIFFAPHLVPVEAAS
jgi:hypothetical protein